MAPLINLPPVSVPSELFQSALSRAGIFLDTPEDLKKLSRYEIKALAKITEEVRRGYIDVMDVLHTQDLVTIPLPGMPSGAAGVPPPIRFESKSLRSLRAGGIPLWMTILKTQYEGIRSGGARDQSEGKPYGNRLMLEWGQEKAENQCSKPSDTRAYHGAGEKGEAPAGQLTLLRGCVDGSPISLLECYLPHSNPDVLKGIQSVAMSIVHRLRSIDWLWGIDTIAPPEFCFARSDISDAAKDRANRHPFPPLPSREIDEDTNQPIEDDPHLLPELPCSLKTFIASQHRQHRDAARISFAHTTKLLDDIFSDLFGQAADVLTQEFFRFEAELAEARKKVSIDTFSIPQTPSGVEPPKIIRKMLEKRDTFNFRAVKVGAFSERSSSQMASACLKPPFRRALFLSNLHVADTLRDVGLKALNNIVNMLEAYQLPVIPSVEDIHLHTKKERPIGNNKSERIASPAKNQITAASIVGLIKNANPFNSDRKEGKRSSGNPLSALTRLLVVKRLGNTLSAKLARQRRKAKKAAQRQRRRSIRAIKRSEIEAQRQAAENSLCLGGASPLTLPKAIYQSQVPYVERMLTCQAIRSGDMSSLSRTTSDIKMSSLYEAVEHKRPIFKLTLNATKRLVNSGQRHSHSPKKSGRKSHGKTQKKRQLTHHPKHEGRHDASMPRASSGILVFDPPLPDFTSAVLKIMQNMCDDSLSQWKAVNIDMLLPYDGSQSRDHRGTFFARNETRKSPLESCDPSFISASKRASSAIRRSCACVMAFVLVLQRYAEFFHFDSSEFSKRIRKEKLQLQQEALGEQNMTSTDVHADGVTASVNRPRDGPGSFKLELASDFERIDRCQRYANEMKGRLIDKLCLHMFEINCRALKKTLVGNAKMMVSLLLRDIALQVRNICKDMNSKFGEYYNLISKWPRTVEEFDEQLRGIDKFEKTVGSLGFQLECLGEAVDGLDDRKFVLSDTDFKQVWHCRGWPKRLAEAREKCIKVSKSHRVRFEEELEEQKKMFGGEMRRLREDFKQITKKGPGDWKESDEVVKSVVTLIQRLNEASEEADLIRRRCEVLGMNFDRDKAEGPGMSLSELRTHTTPFKELWVGVSTWCRNKPEWFDGPFLVLEAEDVADYIRQCWRDMYRLVRVFEADLYDEPARVGNRLKTSIEEFKQYLPLIIKLRNEDLRPRHWKEVSHELGVGLRVDHSLTLRQLVANQAMESMTTISDISQTATLEVQFERNLDHLEAAWDVTGKPDDKPIWVLELEEIDARMEIEKSKHAEKGDSVHHDTVLPICEALRIKFQKMPHIGAWILANPSDLMLTLEDHVLTTEKLSESPYALPFKSRVAGLRRQQDNFHKLIYEWIDLQRTWLKLKSLHDCGAMSLSMAVAGEGSKSARESFQENEKKLLHLLDQWWQQNKGHEPSPNQIMKTPRVVARISAINRGFSKVQLVMEDALQQQFWLNCPRTRRLSIDQCFRFNSLRFYPNEMDTFVSLVFPGARRLLVEPIPETRPVTAENTVEDNSSDNDGDDMSTGEIGLSDSESSDDDDDNDDTLAGDGVLSGQHFSNLMKEVHVMPPSNLLGFGLRSGRESSITQNGNTQNAFFFKSPVQLFKKKKSSVHDQSIDFWDPKPLVVWLSDTESKMRHSLIDAVDHCYNACAMFSQTLNDNEADDIHEAASAFYSWLFFQPAQVIVISMNLLFTGEVGSALRLAEFNSNFDAGSGKDPFGSLKDLEEQALVQLRLVTRFISNQNVQSWTAKRENSKVRPPRPVPIAASSAYISVLMHQHERLQKMYQDIVEESVVVPLSTSARAVSPVDCFQWQATFRYHLRTRSMTDPNTVKPPSSTILARSKYQQPHIFLSADYGSPTYKSFDVEDAMLTLPLTSDGRGPSNVGINGNVNKGPRPFIERSTLSKLIEISNLDTTLQHGLELYGSPEFRATLTPLTARVLRAMVSAQKRFQSFSLVSSVGGPHGSASTEISALLAEMIGRPHYRFFLGGTGMSSLRLHNLLAMTVSTGSWTTFEGIDSLSPGVCSMFASCVVSIDHARKANAGKVFVGSWQYLVQVVQGFNIAAVASDFSVSPKFSQKSVLGYAFHPIHVSVPNLQPIVQLMTLSHGISGFFTGDSEVSQNLQQHEQHFEQQAVHTFSNSVASIFKEAQEANISMVSSGNSFCIAIIRSALQDLIRHYTCQWPLEDKVFNAKKLFGHYLARVYRQQSGNGKNTDAAHFASIISRILEVEFTDVQLSSEFDVNLSKEIDATFKRLEMIATPAVKHHTMCLYEALKLSTLGESLMLNASENPISSKLDSSDSLRSAYRGVLLLGPSGSGKTTIVKCLADALSRLNLYAVESASNLNSTMKECEAEAFDDSDDSDDDNKKVNANLSAYSVQRGERDRMLMDVAVETDFLYPAAVPENIWRGCINPDTGRWRDGLLKSVLERASRGRCGLGGMRFKHSSANSWVVFDCGGSSLSHQSGGWIEDLTSAISVHDPMGMDSTWADCSGASVHIHDRTRFIIETDSVHATPPAIVASLPVIVISGSGSRSQWHMRVTSWLQSTKISLPAVRRVFDELTGMLSLLLPSLLPWICEHARAFGNTAMSTIDVDSASAMRFVDDLLSHLNYSLSPFQPLKGKLLALRVEAEAAKRNRAASLSLVKEMKKPLSLSWSTDECRQNIQGIILSSFINVVASFLKSSYHAKFSDKLVHVLERRSATSSVQHDVHNETHSKDVSTDTSGWRPQWMSSRLTKLRVNLPVLNKANNLSEISLIATHLYYNLENGNFERWEKRIGIDVFPLDMARHRRSLLEARFDRSPTSAFAGDILIPSDDLVRSLYMCGSYIKGGRSVCVIGGQCTGKSVLMQRCIETAVDRATVHVVPLSPHTCTREKFLQACLESCEHKHLGSFSPSWYSVDGEIETCDTVLITIDDVSLVPGEGIYSDSNDIPMIELCRQILGSGTFHDDISKAQISKGTASNSNDFSRSSLAIETCKISGTLALWSCPRSRSQDVFCARAARQFAIVNTSEWDVPHMSSVLKGLSDVYFEHCGEPDGAHMLQSIVPKMINATASLIIRLQEKFDVAAASIETAAKQGGILCRFGFLDAIRIMQSILSVHGDSLISGGYIMKSRLWCHECLAELEGRVSRSSLADTTLHRLIMQIHAEHFIDSTKSKELVESESSSRVYEQSGRSWPHSFAKSIGLIDSDSAPIDEQIISRPLLFSSIPSRKHSEYRECLSWQQVEDKISVMLAQETREGMKRAVEAVASEPEENEPHLGARANENELYHTIPTYSLKSSVNNLVRVFERPFNNNALIIGSGKTGKSTAIKIACKLCDLKLIETNISRPTYYGSNAERIQAEVELADAHIPSAAEVLKQRKLKKRQAENGIYMDEKTANKTNRSVVSIERGSSVVLASKVNTKSFQQFKRDAKIAIKIAAEGKGVCLMIPHLSVLEFQMGIEGITGRGALNFSTDEHRSMGNIVRPVTLTSEMQKAIASRAAKKKLTRGTAPGVHITADEKESTKADSEDLSPAKMAAQQRKAEIEEAEAEEKQARALARSKARSLKQNERLEDLAGDETHLIAKAVTRLADPTLGGEFALSLLSDFEVKQLLTRQSASASKAAARTELSMLILSNLRLILQLQDVEDADSTLSCIQTSALSRCIRLSPSLPLRFTAIRVKSSSDDLDFHALEESCVEELSDEIGEIVDLKEDKRVEPESELRSKIIYAISKFRQCAERVFMESSLVPRENDLEDYIGGICKELKSNTDRTVDKYANNSSHILAASNFACLSGVSRIDALARFLCTFQKLFSFRHSEEKNKLNQLTIAIEELEDSAEFVSTLREELDGMKPVLDRKNKAADIMMKDAKAKRKELNQQVAAVKSEEAIIEETIQEIKDLELQIKAEIELAMPPLEKAIRVIKSLKKQDLDEVKAMQKPPGKVKMTLEVICLFLKLEPREITDPHDLSVKWLDFWPVARSLLANPKELLRSLETYHKKNVDPGHALIERIKSDYLADPEFQPKSIRKASIACEGLCKWSHAIVGYYAAKEALQSKEKRLAEARAHLDAAKMKLEEYRTLVKALEKGLERVEGRLERAIAEKEELQKETSALQKRINNSGELTRALTNEKAKWEGMMLSIEENAAKRLGDALLGAALFAYGGRLDGRRRARLMDSWMTVLDAIGIDFHRKADDDLLNSQAAKTDKKQTHARSYVKQRISLMSNSEVPDSLNEDTVNIFADREGISLKYAGLCTNYELTYWTNCGLPCDTVSRAAETATLIMKYAENGLWPWILEGPLKGVSSCWLKDVYENASLNLQQQATGELVDIVEVSTDWIERDLIRAVRNCMRKGSILIVHVDENALKHGRPLHPVFSPLMNIHPYAMSRPPIDGDEVALSDDSEEWVDPNAEQFLLPSTVWDPLTKTRYPLAPSFRMFFVDSYSPQTVNMNRKSAGVLPKGANPVVFDISSSGLERILLWAAGHQKFPQRMKALTDAMCLVARLDHEQLTIEEKVLNTMATSEGSLTEDEEGLANLMHEKKRYVDNQSDISRARLLISQTESQLGYFKGLKPYVKRARLLLENTIFAGAANLKGVHGELHRALSLHRWFMPLFRGAIDAGIEMKKLSISGNLPGLREMGQCLSTFSKSKAEASKLTKASSTASSSRFQDQRKGDSRKGKEKRGTKKSRIRPRGLVFEPIEESERSATFDQVEAVPVFPVESRPKCIRPSDGVDLSVGLLHILPRHGMVGIAACLGISDFEEAGNEEGSVEDTEFSEQQVSQVMSDNLTQRVAASLCLSTTKDEFEAIMLSMSLQRLRGPHPDDELIDAYEGPGTSRGGEFELGTIYPEEEAFLYTLLSASPSSDAIKARNTHGKENTPLHAECTRAGVTPAQWSRLICLKNIKPSSSSTAPGEHVRLPYNGLVNSLYNDCMAGTGESRQQWVNMLRQVRQRPFSVSLASLPDQYRYKLTAAQATLVIGCFCPQSLVSRVIPEFTTSVLFNLAHVPLPSAPEVGDTHANDKNMKSGTDDGEATTTNVDYEYGAMGLLRQHLYNEIGNPRIPRNIERACNDAGRQSRVPTLIVTNSGNTPYAVLSEIEHLFVHMRRCHGAAIDRRLRWVSGLGSAERGYCSGSKRLSIRGDALLREYSGKYVTEDVGCFIRDLDLAGSAMRGDWIVVTGCSPGSQLLKTLARAIDKFEAILRRQKSSGGSNSTSLRSTKKKPTENKALFAVAPQFRIWVVLDTQHTKAYADTPASYEMEIRCTAPGSSAIPTSLASRAVCISFNSAVSPVQDVLLPHYQSGHPTFPSMLNAATFDLESVYASISGPSSNSTFSLDSVIASAHAFPPAKLLRTLADEIHRSATELQRREWRRLHYACVLLHALIVSRANNDNFNNWGTLPASAENRTESLKALIHSLARCLRRRSIHHHVWAALGASKLMAAITSAGGDPSIATSRLQVEPGLDAEVAKQLKEAASHIYCDPLGSPLMCISKNAAECLVDDVLACVKAGNDPADSLFPYTWGIEPMSLSEPLCLGPEVEPSTQRSKKKRRRRQKRMSPDEIRRMTMQALKRYRDHVGRLSGRDSVGGQDTSENCEWIGSRGVAAKLAGCAQLAADESIVLASKALSQNLIHVDSHVAHLESTTCRRDLAYKSVHLAHLLPDTSTAREIYHDNDEVEEVQLAERCRRAELTLLRQLVERCHSDIEKARDIFSGCAGIICAGSCMGKVHPHMFQVLAAILDGPDEVQVPQGWIDFEIQLSGRAHRYPQSLSLSVWMQKLVEKWKYMTGDFKDYLYGLLEGVSSVDQAVEQKIGSSPLPRIHLGKFARPAAVVSALGRDLQGRSKELGKGITPFVRLSLSLECTASTDFMLDGLSLVNAVWVERGNEGGGCLSEAGIEAPIINPCPKIYASFEYSSAALPAEGTSAPSLVYQCPVAVGGYSPRVTTRTIIGRVSLNSGHEVPSVKYWSKSGVYISAD